MTALRPILPREHGFWTMLGAVLIAAVLRNPSALEVWFVAVCVAVSAALIGGLIRRTVRQSGPAQLVSAATLSLMGVPVELVAGRPVAGAMATALAWASIFLSGALVVRAAFARASPRTESSAGWLDACAIFLPVFATGILAAASRASESLATAIAAISATLLVAYRPTIKHMKRVGLALAVVATAAVLALVF